MTDSDFLTSSLDQPLSLGSTFWDNTKQGVNESFGLGTAIRNLSTPEAAPPTDGGIGDVLGAVNRAIAPDSIIRRVIGTDYDGQAALSEDQYKASPSFRESIPYSPGMTEDRASSLAQADDLKKVREFYAQKRPVTAFLGKLAGSAIDPINYIPIAGEAVAAANAARFGRVGGAALTSSLDAAANTAIFGIGTAPVRGQLGDDVGFQDTLTQVAMAALIGGAFGAVGGALGRGRGSSPELRAEAETKLATLQRVQESRVALNDAIDGMLNRSEVEISPASADFAAQVAERELPKIAIARMAREADQAAFDRLDALNRTFDINEAEISRLLSQTLDNERFGSTRAAMIEADRLAERLKKAEDAIAKAPNEKQRIAATQRRDTARDRLREHLAGIDDATVQELEGIDEALAARRTAQAPVATERQQLIDRTNQLNAEARDRFWQQRFSDRDAVNEPAPAAGMTRVYHSGSAGDGETGRWVSTNRTYASDYRSDLPLYYLDVAENDPRVVNADYPEQGVKQGFTFNFETTPEEAARFVQINRQAASSIGTHTPIQTTSVPQPQVNPALVEAARRVGKPEADRAMAEQYRVNPETGEYPELADIERLRAEGRLTEEDLAALDDADAILTTANSYGEALKAFAACEI